ncbi:MAG: hypothetical protein IJU35_00045 [Paludibacteraceae bacterium]|nr:hypothetical protein [Paludibacteraceae bacterium]
MKKCIFTIVCAVCASTLFAADSYVVKYWGKISGDKSAVSVHRDRQMKETLTADSKLYLNPNDSVVIKNVETKRLYSYVAEDDSKTTVISVGSITKPRLFRVVSEMIRQTREKKPREVEYELLGGVSRSGSSLATLDPRHVALFNTLHAQADNVRSGNLSTHKDLHFALDTIDNSVSFVVENMSKKKSYIINILVLDVKTGEMSLAVNFPSFTTSPVVVIGPNKRMFFRDEVAYEIDKEAPQKFALVVTTNPYDANYLNQMLADRNLSPEAAPLAKDVILIAK